MEDRLIIAGREIESRLFVGTGKFADYRLIPEAIRASRAQVVTVALRRVDFGTPEENMLKYLPDNVVLMPNTSGARDAGEAVRIARIAREAGCGSGSRSRSSPTRSISCPTISRPSRQLRSWSNKASWRCRT